MKGLILRSARRLSIGFRNIFFDRYHWQKRSTKQITEIWCHAAFLANRAEHLLDIVHWPALTIPSGSLFGGGYMYIHIRWYFLWKNRAFKLHLVCLQTCVIMWPTSLRKEQKFFLNQNYLTSYINQSCGWNENSEYILRVIQSSAITSFIIWLT